jgi:3-mercaptopyruvate sulfurtransferase SseA
MLKLSMTFVCTLLSLTAAPAAPQPPADPAAAKLRVEWEEFKKLYDDKTIEVVDVRSEQVFSAGHIPGARLVPLDTVERRVEELKKLGKPIVFYCA